jgi:hypothetical protein
MRRTATLIALAGTLVPAAAASAGTYVVHGCKTPDGKVAATDGWTPNINDVATGASATDNCGGGGSLFAQAHGANPRGAKFGWQFNVPEAVTIKRININRRVVVASGPGPWAYNYTAFQNEANFDIGGNYLESCWASNGDCPGLDGDLVRDLGTRHVTLFSDCTGGGGGYADCAGGGAVVEIRRSEMTLEETSDPAFAGAPAGGLFATGEALSGVEEASFSASDAYSGVAKVALEVDGRTATLGSVTCAQPYTALRPCRESTSGSISWDTRTVADGAHRLRLLVYDATLTNVGAYGPIDVTVRNVSAPDVQTGCAAGDGAITAAFGRASRRTVAFGRRVTVNGRATLAGGAPAAGVEVRVLSGRGTGPFAEQTTTAKPDGTYSIALAPGTSRTVYASFRRACSARLDLRVRARATVRGLKRSVRNGRIATFTGRVLSGPMPSAGKLILLQARSPRTGRWQTLDTARTNQRGTFRGSYRFRRTFRATTYSFRVSLPVESGYPYAAGTSNTARVRVRP